MLDIISGQEYDRDAAEVVVGVWLAVAGMGGDTAVLEEVRPHRFVHVLCEEGVSMAWMTLRNAWLYHTDAEPFGLALPAASHHRAEFSYTTGRIKTLLVVEKERMVSVVEAPRDEQASLLNQISVIKRSLKVPAMVTMDFVVREGAYSQENRGLDWVHIILREVPAKR